MAQLIADDMDEKDFDQILPILKEARKTGGWVILGGHEMGDSAFQTTRISMLKRLCQYVLDPANGIWVAPVGTVTKYVLKEQEKL